MARLQAELARDSDAQLAEAFPPTPLTPELRSILNFHLANLEYGNAATLDKVSLTNWDQVW